MADEKDGIQFFDKSDNLSPHEKELVDCVICMPLSILPVPHVKAHIEQCDLCMKNIWVAESSPKIPKKICVYCMPDAIEQAKASEKARQQ